MVSGDVEENSQTPQFDPQAKTSKIMGIIGIITIIFGIGIILGLIALILGIKSLSRIRQSQGQITGTESAKIGIITGAISGIIAPILLLVFFMNQPNAFEKSITITISEVKVGENSIAYALQAYHVDYHTYPEPDLDKENKPVVSYRLTTPVAYLAGLVYDPFKNNGEGFFEYDKRVLPTRKFADKFPSEEWIITSYGPDRKDGNSGAPGGTPLIEKTALSDSTLGFPLATSPLTYDPTNGLVSPGDIWKRGP